MKLRYHVLYYSPGNPVRQLLPVVMPYRPRRATVLEVVQRIVDGLGLDHKVEDRRLGKTGGLEWTYDIYDYRDRMAASADGRGTDNDDDSDVYLELVAA